MLSWKAHPYTTIQGNIRTPREFHRGPEAGQRHFRFWEGTGETGGGKGGATAA